MTKLAPRRLVVAALQVDAAARDLGAQRQAVRGAVGGDEDGVGAPVLEDGLVPALEPRQILAAVVERLAVLGVLRAQQPLLQRAGPIGERQRERQLIEVAVRGGQLAEQLGEQQLAGGVATAGAHLDGGAASGRHVAMYLGDNLMIEAASSTKGVVVSPVRTTNFSSVGRIW